MADIQDDVFDALSNEQRRQLLFTLVEYEESIDIDSPPDGFDGGQGAIVERYHVHLPKLADYGFIEWDPQTNVVEEGPRFETIRSVLRLLLENRETLPATLA
ncbi:hypothetical protein [Haloterrigena alkaliphila]|uniref:ArsR family transcriptional regulator n=1 Tax=Haloterrigena alkaliphila TaxID=2816475 RepID=A0A8A2VBW0_9EURY|nr:hypothetical protein [Haloterrigena alkaliphila]QSW97934.1 hypothetical protein J0X25_10940 [Haloterrigena alkaliphila]